MSSGNEGGNENVKNADKGSGLQCRRYFWAVPLKIPGSHLTLEKRRRAASGWSSSDTMVFDRGFFKGVSNLNMFFKNILIINSFSQQDYSIGVLS